MQETEQLTLHFPNQNNHFRLGNGQLAVGTYTKAYGQFLLSNELTKGTSFSMELCGIGIVKMHVFSSMDSAVSWIESGKPMPTPCQRFRNYNNGVTSYQAICEKQKVVFNQQTRTEEGRRRKDFFVKLEGTRPTLGFDIECGDVKVSVMNMASPGCEPVSPSRIFHPLGTGALRRAVFSNGSQVSLKAPSPSGHNFCLVDEEDVLRPETVITLKTQNCHQKPGSHFRLWISREKGEEEQLVELPRSSDSMAPKHVSVCSSFFLLEQSEPENFLLVVKPDGLLISRGCSQHLEEKIDAEIGKYKFTLWIEFYRLAFTFLRTGLSWDDQYQRLDETRTFPVVDQRRAMTASTYDVHDSPDQPAPREPPFSAPPSQPQVLFFSTSPDRPQTLPVTNRKSSSTLSVSSESFLFSHSRHTVPKSLFMDDSQTGQKLGMPFTQGSAFNQNEDASRDLTGAVFKSSQDGFARSKCLENDLVDLFNVCDVNDIANNNSANEPPHCRWRTSPQENITPENPCPFDLPSKCPQFHTLPNPRSSAAKSSSGSDTDSYQSTVSRDPFGDQTPSEISFNASTFPRILKTNPISFPKRPKKIPISPPKPCPGSSPTKKSPARTTTTGVDNSAFLDSDGYEVSFGSTLKKTGSIVSKSKASDKVLRRFSFDKLPSLPNCDNNNFAISTASCKHEDGRQRMHSDGSSCSLGYEGDHYYEEIGQGSSRTSGMSSSQFHAPRGSDDLSSYNSSESHHQTEVKMFS